VYRTILIALGATALALSAGACGGTQPVPSGRPPAARSSSPDPRPRPQDATATAPAVSRSRSGRAGLLQVLTEPAAGVGPVYRLINGARSSVDLSMYELVDTVAEHDLAAAARRGVDVRVILDRYLEKSRNTPAFRYLAAHGVQVRWGPASVIYHQKTLTVDDATSLIMTGNLVTEYYADTRDFTVIDTDRADVHAIVATFDADFAGRSIDPPDGTDLVWSPINAESSVLAVINGSTRTLAVENEEMDDPAVTAALAAAARRGVYVTITMTEDSEWDQAFDELARAGVHIRLYPDDASSLYIHAKALAADAKLAGRRVLVGSQNFSVASLDYNRELGVLTRDRTVVARIAATIASDYAHARPYRAAESGPGSSARSAAWCSATATIYDAADDENNVYVDSNQPDQDATATAGGYSHSYWTNSSGYALIYLNGPAPGASITVTVGAATCTTRD